MIFLFLFIALWPFLMLYLYSRISCYTVKYRNFFLYLAAFPMFLIIAIRGESIGADTGVYARHFVAVLNTSLETAIEDSRMEVGYITFVKYLGYITTNPKIYQVVCACIYYICMMSFVKQLKGNDGFFFFFFFCTLGLFMFMFTGVRQCIAISICLFTYKYLICRKYLICLLFLGVAFTFHKSSFLFLLALLIWSRRINFSNLFLYTLVLYFASYFLFQAQMFLNDQLDYNYQIEETGSGQIFLTVVLIFTVLSWYVLQINKPNTIYEKGLFNINYITLIFWFLRLQTRVAERPSYYFLAFSCALYAYSMNNLPYGVNRILIRSIVVLFCLVLYVYRLSTNFSTILEYGTFF